MKEISKTTRRKKYDEICESYVHAFIKKQEIEFDGWAGQDIGGIAGFIGQYFFNLSDIIYDIDNNCKKGLILEWQDYCLEQSHNNYLSYYAYSKGARLDNSPSIKK